MKFKGKTYETNDPTVRSIAFTMKVNVERGTYRSPGQLRDELQLEIWNSALWPGHTRVRVDGTEVTVTVNDKAVIGFSHRLITAKRTGDPMDVEIQVRRANDLVHHARAVGGMKATSTSSHQRAADALVYKYFSKKYKAVHVPQRDRKYRKPERQPWEQVQVFKVVKSNPHKRA
jgi:hypothetical protein